MGQATGTPPQQHRRRARKDAWRSMEGCYQVWRARPHCTLLPSTIPKKYSSPASVKLERGGTMGELPPATTSSSLTLSHLRLGRLGHTRGLYVDCCINGTQCRALVDTGSTISLIRPGTLPGTAVSKPRGWKATKLRITTVTGERARMLGKRSLPVTVAKRSVGHEFWLANIQDSCIIGLDLLSKLRAVVDVPGATLYLDGGSCSTPFCW
ncbi:hypothetical protein L3Q82_006485 [Scortum barcoo]|uniref:Uncharacterized protein n=1 Tax=Scortum barcoo TaxID=214431 RepID=A0ACB8X2H9_9TELE|nr:hypothetical protein L3Q82_006485 [Scortum barcoo]